MAEILGLILVSFATTALLIVPYINLLYQVRLQRSQHSTVDMFNKKTPIFDRLHGWKVGTPVGGGLLVMTIVAILFALVIYLRGVLHLPVTSVYEQGKEVFILFFTFVSFGILGLYDDLIKTLGIKKRNFGGLRFRHKFLAQWVLAGIVASMLNLGLGLDIIYISPGLTLDLGSLYIPFAAFVIVAFANAFNISDGLDGLATGLLVICLIVFWVISSTILDSVLSIFIGAWLGALFAFLYFNIYPARIWLGDVGTMSFGATLGLIGLLLGKTIALAIIGGVFVLEVGSSLLQILAKKITGRRIFTVAPIHLYFQHRGWEEPKIVMRFWLIGALFAIFGLWLALIRG